jgi:hypothetical protein
MYLAIVPPNVRPAQRSRARLVLAPTDRDQPFSKPIVLASTWREERSDFEAQLHLLDQALPLYAACAVMREVERERAVAFF